MNCVTSHFSMRSISLNRSVLQFSRRWISSNKNQPISAKVSSIRSYLITYIEQRRKQVQKHDIRLEPYLSKGVYTESGAIRPVSFRAAIIRKSFFSNDLDAKTISTWNRESVSRCISVSLSRFCRKQIRSFRLGKNGCFYL